MIYAIYLPTLITTAISIVLTLAWLFSWLGNDSTTTNEMNIIRVLSRYIVVPVLDGVVLVVLPIVFLIVPALARRLADDESPLSLLNPLPTLSLIFANFGDYVLTRIAVFGLGILVSMVALFFNVLPVIGVLAGWMLLAMGRFWGRLLWAYSLAHMRHSDHKVLTSNYLSPSPVGNRS
jgi:hypothetical protein